MSRLISWSLLLSLAAPSLADEKKIDAEARAKAVAPFLDEQIIAVGHVDLTRVDVNAIAEKLSEYAKLKEEEIAARRRRGRKTPAFSHPTGRPHFYRDRLQPRRAGGGIDVGRWSMLPRLLPLLQRLAKLA